MDNGLFRVADLCADGGAQAEAHGAETAGGQQLTGVVIVEMLRDPHLMLPDVRRYDSIHRTQAGNGIGDLLRRQRIAGLVVLRLRFKGEDIALPIAVMLLGQPLVQKLQDPLCVADDMMVCLDIFVDLCPVNVDLDDPCLAGKALRVQRDPVGEPAADGDQQIAAVAGDI